MADSADTATAFWSTVQASLKMRHEAAAVAPAPREAHLPLSLAQERLWLIDRCQPGSTAHNLGAAFRLRGALDAAALERSVREIVRRHEILRTCFPAVDGRPIQAISAEPAVPLTPIDLEALPPQAQEAEIRRLAAAQIGQPFDLSHGPLMRLSLIRLGAEHHVLLRAVHHIVNDRWSDSVFMRELAVLYRAFRAGEPSPLPALPVQYADIAHAQRQALRDGAMAAELDYWKRQLDGCPPAVRLPFDRAMSQGPSGRGGAHHLALPGNLSEALKTLSRNEGVSLFVVLLAAFKALLHQYSEQDDMAVCVAVAGRHRVETRKLIGYFNNLVLVRSDLGGSPSLRELVRRVSQATAGAFEHQDLPLQHVADALNLPGTVLSGTLFALQNVPSQPLALADIGVAPLDLEESAANFDVFLSVRQRDGDLSCVLRYRSELFEAATIADLLERYRRLLADLAADPDRRLSSLPRFTPAPASSRAAEADGGTAPANELERRIAAVWREVLHLEQIGMHANFFDLGGRSLAMIELCRKLQTALNRDIPLRELFGDPTIHGMARQLGGERSAEAEAPLSAQDRTQKRQDALKRQKQRMERQRKRNEPI